MHYSFIFAFVLFVAGQAAGKGGIAEIPATFRETSLSKRDVNCDQGWCASPLYAFSDIITNPNSSVL